MSIIRISTFGGSFHAGGTISGEISLTVTNPFTTRSVLVYLKGEEKVTIEKIETEVELKVTPVGVTPHSSTKTKTYNLRNTFLAKGKILLGVDWPERKSGQVLQLNVGTHVLPYSFQLPAVLPPYFRRSGTDWAQIVYYLEVKVDSATLLSFNKEKIGTVKVVGYQMPRAALLPLLSKPVPISRKTEKTFLLSEGKLSLVGKLNSKYVVSGQMCDFEVWITNNSQKTVNNISFFILIQSTLSAKGESEKVTNTITYGSMEAHVPPGGKFNKKYNITPSEDLELCTVSTKGIETICYFGIEAHVSSYFAKNLILYLPITLLHKPPASFFAIPKAAPAATAKPPVARKANIQTSVGPAAPDSSLKTAKAPAASPSKPPATATSKPPTTTTSTTTTTTTTTAASKSPAVIASPKAVVTKGTIQLPNGGIYEGKLLNEKTPHGEGVLTFSNGDVFKGIWCDGKIVDGVHTFFSTDDDDEDDVEGEDLFDKYEDEPAAIQLSDGSTDPFVRALVNLRKQVENNIKKDVQEEFPLDHVFQLFLDVGRDCENLDRNLSAYRKLDENFRIVEKTINRMVVEQNIEQIEKLIRVFQTCYGVRVVTNKTFSGLTLRKWWRKSFKVLEQKNSDEFLRLTALSLWAMADLDSGRCNTAFSMAKKVLEECNKYSQKKEITNASMYIICLEKFTATIVTSAEGINKHSSYLIMHSEYKKLVEIAEEIKNYCEEKDSIFVLLTALSKLSFISIQQLLYKKGGTLATINSELSKIEEIVGTDTFLRNEFSIQASFSRTNLKKFSEKVDDSKIENENFLLLLQLFPLTSVGNLLDFFSSSTQILSDPMRAITILQEAVTICCLKGFYQSEYVFAVRSCTKASLLIPKNSATNSDGLSPEKLKILHQVIEDHLRRIKTFVDAGTFPGDSRKFNDCLRRKNLSVTFGVPQKQILSQQAAVIFTLIEMINSGGAESISSTIWSCAKATLEGILKADGKSRRTKNILNNLWLSLKRKKGDKEVSTSALSSYSSSTTTSSDPDGGEMVLEGEEVDKRDDDTPVEKTVQDYAADHIDTADLENQILFPNFIPLILYCFATLHKNLHENSLAVKYFLEAVESCKRVSKILKGKVREEKKEENTEDVNPESSPLQICYRLEMDSLYDCFTIKNYTVTSDEMKNYTITSDEMSSDTESIQLVEKLLNRGYEIVEELFGPSVAVPATPCTPAVRSIWLVISHALYWKSLTLSIRNQSKDQLEQAVYLAEKSLEIVNLLGGTKVYVESRQKRLEIAKKNLNSSTSPQVSVSSSVSVSSPKAPPAQAASSSSSVSTSSAKAPSAQPPKSPSPSSAKPPSPSAVKSPTAVSPKSPAVQSSPAVPPPSPSNPKASPAVSQAATPSQAKPPAIVKWMPDEAVNDCCVCATPFSFTCRKHHCRLCGQVVCDLCAPKRSHSSLGSGVVERICTPCFSFK